MNKYLLAIRLDNAASIAAAYGDRTVLAALVHLRQSLHRQLGMVELHRMGHDEFEVVVHADTLEPALLHMQVDDLCTELGLEPFSHDGTRIVLSVSAGYAIPADGQLWGREEEARNRLLASTAQADHPQPHSAKWQWLYRDDMARAVILLGEVARGEAFFAWRPVYKPQDPDQILHYEALLSLPSAAQIDCAEARGSLERLGMAYLLDRQLVSRALDELAADPLVSIAVGISAQSLSFHLNGQDAAWTELLTRLRRDHALAARLIIEIQEASPIHAMPDALAFIGELRALGVRISVAGFGSGFASIRQLLVLRPDIVKLESAFLHTADQSDRDRARISHLLGLARTVGDKVIVDGVETLGHMHLAVQEGAEWVASFHNGRASTARLWLQGKSQFLPLQADAADADLHVG